MFQILLYVLTFVAGFAFYHLFQRWLFRWSSRREGLSRDVMRALNHDGFVRYKRIVDDEAKRRAMT